MTYVLAGLAGNLIIVDVIFQKPKGPSFLRTIPAPVSKGVDK
jgi:hypothetical protein